MKRSGKKRGRVILEIELISSLPTSNRNRFLLYIKPTFSKLFWALKKIIILYLDYNNMPPLYFIQVQASHIPIIPVSNTFGHCKNREYAEKKEF